MRLYVLLTAPISASLSKVLLSTPMKPARLSTRPAQEPPVPLRIHVYNDPVSVEVLVPNVFELSLSIVGITPADFSGSLYSFGTPPLFKRTASPTRWTASVIAKGLLSYTFFIDIEGQRFVLVPTEQPRIGFFTTNQLPGCVSVVDRAVACFREPNADRALCSSRAQSDEVRACCNEAALRHLYVECLPSSPSLA